MKVTPVSKTLADVLRGNFLRIPRFQRPYDWDRDNLTEFWNDVKDRSDPEYFMGSLVVFLDEKENNLISIVDGQQRITTITIMLAILRDTLSDLGEAGMASGIHELIETRDLDSKSRFVLEHVPADTFMQIAIQQRNPEHKYPATSTQQQNLQTAHRFLSQSLSSHMKIVIGDKKIDRVNYCRHLRDCLLRMHFISIELDDEDGAYIIFETLNTRGKDLRVSDLLKNHFMRLLPPTTKGLDRAKNDWTDMMETLSSATVSIDPDSFLAHYWLSRHSYVSKANLFINYKEKIKKTNAKSFLDEIKIASTTYMRCMAPMESKFSKEERSVQESINAVRIFGVAQAAPLMLSIMTLYERNIISLKTARKSFELIENFTFQFNAMAQSRGGGGVANMYARLAQNSMLCANSQEFSNHLLEIESKFSERLPDITEFSLGFTRITFRSNYTRERALARYVLTKLSRHYGMPKEIDLNLLTIEHILPQSKGEETGDEFDVGAIGNLIFVSEAINAKLATKPFSEKKKLFIKENHVHVDEYLAAATSWDADQIAERGVHLAGVGHESIWNI